MEEANKLVYSLREKPNKKYLLIYTFQWWLVMISSNIFYPLILGKELGFTPLQLVAMSNRSLFFAGVFSLIQGLWGYKLPVMDGLASIWVSVYVLIFQIGGKAGNVEFAMQQIEGIMIMCGIIIVLLALTGMMGRIKKLFTPLIAGSLLILLSLQLSGNFMRGMLGIKDGLVRGGTIGVSLLILIVMIFLLYWAKPKIRSLAALIGLLLGWGLMLVTGQAPLEIQLVSDGSLLAIPQLFPWGLPIFSIAGFVNAAFMSIVVISNQFTSSLCVADACREDLTDDRFRRGGLVNGIAHIVTGAFASIGTIPYASSGAFIEVSKVATIYPYLGACILLAVGSLTWQLGSFFGNIPAAVTYAVAFAMFTQLIAMGIKNYLRTELNERSLLIIGFTLMTGVGVMFVPSDAFQFLPGVIRNIVSNGLLMGTLVGLILEHLAFRKKQIKKAS